MNWPFSIAITGISGSGKTSILRLLARHYLNQNLPVFPTIEPGGTFWGRHIPKLVHSNSSAEFRLGTILLFAADHIRWIAEIALPTRRRSGMLLSEGCFEDLGLCISQLPKPDQQLAHQICTRASRGFVPDLIFVLDLPAQIAATRSHLSVTLHDLQQARFQFMSQADQDPSRYCLVDAREPIHKVFAAVLDTVEGLRLASSNSYKDRQ